MRFIEQSRFIARKFGRHVIALLLAPMLVAGVSVVTTPARPVEAAAWCGVVPNHWVLTYHDSAAWWVNAVGYDQNGNQQSAWIHTYLAVTRDNDHCWLENTDVHFYWYDNSGGYLGETDKQLLPYCYQIANIPMWCYAPWSAPAQVYGP